jgi:spermidine/putrescine transport system substrate-binding protein
MRCLLGLLLFAATYVHAADVLHLYNWNDYIAPETIERFEKSCACKVQQSYFSDNEEMLAKLAAGARGYDVLVPTSNYIQGMVKQGWLQPLDHSKLPNLKNVMTQYLNTRFDPGNKFSAPYAMSITMIGYNDERIKALSVPVGSWATIFDPKILEKIRGRVTVLDSQSELMAAALKYLDRVIRTARRNDISGPRSSKLMRSFQTSKRRRSLKCWRTLRQLSAG